MSFTLRGGDDGTMSTWGRCEDCAVIEALINGVGDRGSLPLVRLMGAGGSSRKSLLEVEVTDGGATITPFRFTDGEDRGRTTLAEDVSGCLNVEGAM